MMGGRRVGLRGSTATLIAALLILSLSGTAGSTPPAEYVVGTGDLLEVSVWGYPDLTRQIAIAPDGNITLPLVGSISTAGMTVQRLISLLAKAYAEFIVDPHVMVTIREYRKLHASVLGQVAKPGAYDLPLGTRLLDLIAAGGGLTDTAALKEAQLLRPGRPPVVVDLTRAIAGDAVANVSLAGGETLVVPEDLTGYVIVQGEVVRPGRYRLKGEMRVIDVLALAGGLTERASVTQSSLTRGTAKAEPLALDSLLLRQEMDRNVPLQPGDILTVPEETNNKIYVIGDVKTPGVFPLKGQVTLLQAIAMAGGPEQRGPGTAKSAYVVRRGGGDTPSAPVVQAGPPVPGSPTPRPLPNGRTLITADLSSIMHDPSKDVAVQPGDVVVLPMSGFGAFQVIASILSGFWGIFR
jgi:polysaccharide biosynthesis/export protein